MSYDLFIFRSVKPLEVSAAEAVYARACEKKDELTTELEASAGIELFHEDLVGRFPDLDEDDHEDESPFACAIVRTDRYVILSVVFSRADEVTAFVEERALVHGLDCFDPQDRRLVGSRDVGAKARPAPAPKLPRGVGLARLVDGISAPLEALGFAPATRSNPKAWSRTTPAGVVHQILLEVATNEVRLVVAFGVPSAMKVVERVRPKEKRLLPLQFLSGLYFRGWIPGQAWAPKKDPKEDDFSHAICHDECVAQSIALVPGAVERYALPLFALMPTPAALDELMGRAVPFETPRPNWGGAEFWERYLNNDVSLLHRVALAKLVRGDAGASAVVESCRSRIASWKAAQAGYYSPELERQFEELAALDVASLLADSLPEKSSKKKRVPRS